MVKMTYLVLGDLERLRLLERDAADLERDRDRELRLLRLRRLLLDLLR